MVYTHHYTSHINFSQLPVVRSEHVRILFDSTQSLESESSLSQLTVVRCAAESENFTHFSFINCLPLSDHYCNGRLRAGEEMDTFNLME